MQLQDDNQPYDDINVTPMLDLAYVLLVIFIIMTTASVQGIKVNLPKASAAPPLFWTICASNFTAPAPKRAARKAIAALVW